MDFEPQTEKEIDDELLLADGVYDFEVTKAEDAVSKKGNSMVAITLRVFAPDGSTRILNDWLLPAPALSKKKLARFCRSVGLEKQYDAGKVTAMDCEGRSGKVVIKRKTDPEYGEQARVETYEPAGSSSRPTAPVKDDRQPAAVPAPADCPF